MTTQEYIDRDHITMTAKRVATNPNMNADMDHWSLKLSMGGPQNSMTIRFSMGKGHNGEAPKLADVLECLASDAAGYENARSFEDWAAEYGYDTDSRKAERTFKAVERQTKKLQDWLGLQYQTLVWDVEQDS